MFSGEGTEDGIMKLMKINVKLSYGCSLVAEPMAEWGEIVCQHWVYAHGSMCSETDPGAEHQILSLLVANIFLQAHIP